MTLQRVSISMRVAHLSIRRTKISAAWKSVFPDYSVAKLLPRHANNTLPYIKILTANAFTNYILTLTLCKFNILTFALIQLKAFYAFTMRSFNILSGFLLLLSILIPRYLNYATFFNILPLQAIVPAQFTNIHTVLSVFTFSWLLLQKATKPFNRIYNCL
jgi:hypothetical protein